MFFIISNNKFLCNIKFLRFNFQLSRSSKRIDFELLKKANFGLRMIVFVYGLVTFGINRVRVGNNNSVRIKVGVLVLN